MSKRTIRRFRDTPGEDEVVVDSTNLDIMPMGDLALCEQLSAERTAGGIIVPESAQRRNFPVYRVLAVGPGKVNDQGVTLPMHVQVGDLVCVAFEMGMVIDVPGRPSKTLLAAREAIVAKVEFRRIETLEGVLDS